MLRGRDVDEIKELKREGLSIRAISRLTGYDRKTISRYLLAPGGRPVYGPRPVQMGKLEPFKQYLKERLKAGVWNAQVLFRELRERNYGGGYSTLTEWLRPQRKDALTVAVRRFETLPGKQAQVDWGHLGSLSEASAEHMLWGFLAREPLLRALELCGQRGLGSRSWQLGRGPPWRGTHRGT